MSAQQFTLRAPAVQGALVLRELEELARRPALGETAEEVAARQVMIIPSFATI